MEQVKHIQQQWEYRQLTLSTRSHSREQIEKELNIMGAARWEMVSCHWHNDMTFTATFKRPT